MAGLQHIVEHGVAGHWHVCASHVLSIRIGLHTRLRFPHWSSLRSMIAWLVRVHIRHLMLLLHLLLIHLPSLAPFANLILLSLDLLWTDEADRLLVKAIIVVLHLWHLIDLMNSHIVQIPQPALQMFLHSRRQLRLAHNCV